MSNRRKRLTSCLGSVLAIALTSISFAYGDEADRGVDPSGTWKWQRTFGDNRVEFTLRLDLKANTVDGTYASPRGQAKIEEAKLEGDELSFQVRREFNGRELTIQYRGNVGEDVIKGKGNYSFDGDTREFDWEAQRALERADVVGTWQLQVETLYADFIMATVTIKQADDTLQGVYTDPRGEAEVKNIRTENAELTFDVFGQSNAVEWKQVFKGKPRGNSIKGTYDYHAAGRTGTLTFHGKRASSK